MKNIKKQEIIPLLLAVLFIVSIFSLYMYKLSENKSLSDNSEYSYATIVDFSSGPRMRYYFDYVFFVDKKKHQGSGRHYPKTDSLSIGDTIIVVYDKTDINNNKPLRDY